MRRPMRGLLAAALLVGAAAGAQAPAARADSARPLWILLDLTAYRLELREGDSTLAAYPVAIGMRAYRTPIGRFAVDHIIWNPAWIPPDSWWARREKPQKPGWGNNMGRVKLHVTGAVYVHGSPFEESLGRAASHACVRMRSVDALAVARAFRERTTLSALALDSLEVDTTLTREVVVRPPVPVEVRYTLAELRADSLVLRDDPYLKGRAAQLAAATEALRAHGIDSASIDERALRRMIARARRRSPERRALQPYAVLVDSVVR